MARETAVAPTDPPVQTKHPEQQRSGLNLSDLFSRYAGVGLLALMVLVFALALPGKFFVYDNLIGLMNTQAIAAIVALGLLFPLAAGAFDISIAGAITLSVVLVSWLFQTTTGSMPIPAAIAITLAAAVVIGAINALLVVRIQVDPFIATIGTSSVMLGIAEMIGNGETIGKNIPGGFTDLGREKIFSIPLPVIYVVVLAIVLWYVLEQTPYGRRVYATGAGGEAARLSGVRTKKILASVFLVSAGCAVLAGIIYAAELGAAPPNTGASFLLPAYASAFLGSTMIRPGRFNVGGLMVAVLIVAVGINGLQLAGTPFWVVDVYQGTILIIAVSLARLRGRRA
jgi:ribose transport system permease protein